MNRNERCLGRAMLLVAAVLAALPAVLSAGEREKPVSELIAIAKSRNQNSLARVAAIEKLGAITEAGVLRDNKVGDELIAIAKGDAAKSDDIFVRIAAIKACGDLQREADKALKDRYLVSYTAMLRDQKEHFAVRKAVARVRPMRRQTCTRTVIAIRGTS